MRSNMLPTRSPRNSMEDLAYYHPQLQSMEQVSEVMSKYVEVTGSFLLRNSFSKKGIYTVSVLHRNGVKHFNVGMNEQGYFLQDDYFSTMDQLIRYYAQHDVPNIENITGVRLNHPILEVGSLSPSSSTRSLDHLVQYNGSILESGSIGRRVSEGNIVHTPRPVMSPRRHGSADPCLPTMASSPGSTAGPPLPPARKASLPLEGSGNHSSRGSTSSDVGSSHTNSVSESIPEDDPVPLPVCVSKQKSPTKNGGNNKRKGFFGLKKHSEDKTKEKKNKSKSDPLMDRPPPALPRETSERFSSPSDASYAEVRDLDEDRTSDLILQLQIAEDFQGHSNRCRCGLLLADTDLPLGWSVHRSTEQISCGRLFFTGPTQETRWDLPSEVEALLTSEQQGRLAWLRRRSQSEICHGSQSRDSYDSSRSSRSSGRSSTHSPAEEVFL